MKITNKEVIQSYLVTSARYDFSAYEKRILYRMVEMFQCALEGQKLDKHFQINDLLFDDLKEVTMPVSAFLKDEKDENHAKAKKALFDLNNKFMEYEDDEIWKIIRIIEMPKLIKRGYVNFVVQKEIYDALLTFTKGFRKYELKTAFGFESIYTMRFYELFSNKHEPITYSISNLKIMFKLEGKYKKTMDFIKRIIIPAKAELDKKAPFSFEYKLNKAEGTKKYISITFYPYEIPANMDEKLQAKKLRKRTSVKWDIDRMIYNYLHENYHFTPEEINNNRKLFNEAAVKTDLIAFLASKRRLAGEKRNPKGYIINAIKSEIKKTQAQ